MSKFETYLAGVLILIGIAFGVPDYSSAQTVTRLTSSIGPDITPAWDPRGGTIAYLRPKVSNGSVYEAYMTSSSGQGGELPLLTGLNSPFGVAVALSWIGSTGLLAVDEAISGFELLKFNTALAPFDRTVANGSDSANELLLSINGGGGAGLTRISRDGLTALIRFSTSGSAGLITIRTGPVSSMVGQTSSAFGTILTSAQTGDTPFLNGGALSPDGSTYVLAAPIGSSSTPHDLLIASTTSGGAQTNITNLAASGISSINPDISPDGSKIVFSRKAASSSTYDLYMINLDGTGLTQLTNTPNFSELSPSWSPDGSSVAFQGIHSVGFESESPALPAGEAANWNIYILTLPAMNVVTPKTKLTEPPLCQVEGRKATFTLAPFARAQKSAVLARAFSMLRMAQAKKSSAKYSFRYELLVTKGAGKKSTRTEKISKRNRITISKLPPGTYSAKYRVEILQKVGSAVTSAGKTKYSPRATFSVS